MKIEPMPEISGLKYTAFRKSYMDKHKKSAMKDLCFVLGAKGESELLFFKLPNESDVDIVGAAKRHYDETLYWKHED